jgi:PIN domain
VIPVVVADADTLFGATTRGLLIHLDYRNLIRLHWSALILDELSRALVDTGRKADEQSARRHEQLLRLSLPNAEVAATAVDAQMEVVAHAVRSKNDVHVAACAHTLAAGQHYPHVKTVNLVTKNIRDFGVRKLADLGIEVSRPDDFLLALFDRSPGELAAAFGSLRATLRSSPTPEALLERLATDGQARTASAMQAALQRKTVQL